ncbi:TetR/AcrR family transcriptional regulator [Fluviicoccus keumensis]|nr:TetR/AcrR family transcriptional regulator [Fluviicoccus keumensis]
MMKKDTVPVRQRMSAADRRAQLLDAARRVADAEGFGAVSIERIAAECGVTRTLIYQQFTSLAGLLEALVDREFARASHAFLKAVMPSSPDQQDRFLAAMAGVLRAVDEDPATWRMFLMPSEGGPPELYEKLAQGQALTRQYFTALFASLSPDTRLHASPDPELTIHLMHVMGDELVKLRLRDPAVYTVERLLAQFRWIAGEALGRR